VHYGRWREKIIYGESQKVKKEISFGTALPSWADFYVRECGPACVSDQQPDVRDRLRSGAGDCARFFLLSGFVIAV
jgi:hypothetical protein